MKIDGNWKSDVNKSPTQTNVSLQDLIGTA